MFLNYYFLYFILIDLGIKELLLKTPKMYPLGMTVGKMLAYFVYGVTWVRFPERAINFEEVADV